MKNIYNITYGTVKEIYKVGIHKRRVYGIAAFECIDDNEAMNIVACVRDISPSKSKVDKLVSIFNRSGLSPLHLHDAVEDFINQ